MSDHCDTAAWPLVCEKQRLPRQVFRSSIAWLSEWLSTLRSAGYPNPTQDSLPVAGQALLDGIRTRKVPMIGFKVVRYISSPYPKLCLAQSHQLQTSALSPANDEEQTTKVMRAFTRVMRTARLSGFTAPATTSGAPHGWYVLHLSISLGRWDCKLF